jgi:hypothetical protein
MISTKRQHRVDTKTNPEKDEKTLHIPRNTPKMVGVAGKRDAP